MSSWTVTEEACVETQVSEAARQLAAAIQTEIPTGRVRVAAIIGGYGRGEGGVERVDGGSRPHNNLDVLVVTLGKRQLTQNHQEAVRAATSQVEASCGIPVDVGYVTEHQLATSRPRVMWYDVSKGHRVLFGDTSFLSGLDQYRADNIPVDDIVDLITNRGALAVIAKALVLATEPSEWAAKHALKGTMKAIVGYGDALLWQRGLYHVSYREKARRMKTCSSIDTAIRTLYAEAVDFRFQPNYKNYLRREATWVLYAIEELEVAHRTFASREFGCDVNWNDYPEAMLRQCLRTRSIRGWAAHLRTEAREYRNLGATPQVSRTWLERLSLRRHRLAALLPEALYVGGIGACRDFIGQWADECDANFPEKLRTELQLEGAR